ncbi:MAG: ATP-binding protein [Clostridia bacterium]
MSDLVKQEDTKILTDVEQKTLRDLQSALDVVSRDIYKEHYKHLKSYDVKPLEDVVDADGEYGLDLSKKTSGDVMSFVKLNKVTYKKDEEVLQKLTNVFNATANENTHIIFLINSLPNKPIDFYIGVATKSRNKGTAVNSLKSCLKANFPGSTYDEVRGNEVITLFEETIYGEESPKKLSAISTVGSRRDNSETQNKAFLQGIERLIDTMQNKEYVGVFIATKMSDAEISLVEDRLKTNYTTISQFKKINLSLNNSDTESIAKSLSEGSTTTITNSGGINVGIPKIAGVNYNHSLGKSDSTTNTYGVTTSLTTGKTIQIEMEDKKISSMLENLDVQYERIKEGKDYGLYSVGAYFLSNKSDNISLASNTYKALLTGENVSCEASAINVWDREKEKISEIKKYLKYGENPIFTLESTEVSSATVVTGLELPLHMNLPQKSVYGIDVIEHAEFGRNVKHTYENDAIILGKMHHMGQVEENSIELSKKALSSHTFITGSTGSGKSNTIYKMLDELTKNDVKFMVIEPAKGEYKDVFGGREDVTVYGTNPYKAPNLLGINPFSFPKDIHILEHIDRLVEIFNACWPMYAAMPAILKDAIEQAYEECGWNLRTSRGSNKFPTFETLLNILPKVIDTSNYSADTSSDYKGALVTRVRSLTKGINGVIFDEDIDNDVLFNENAIIDLSRIGSNETKSLIMGILVLKLQEFRMSEDVSNNSELRHITVLEEAHNLLKRTSSEQSQDSSNLQGKSVEMIANAIAEMRTYGEGFIIADQSPGLMDMSVIRNTNTKIIMRLPDEEDRILVGKAAGLNDEQIVELSRLDTGVAATFQGGWLEPVLCKVDRFIDEKPLAKSKFEWVDTKEQEKDLAIQAFLNNIFGIDRRELTKEEVDVIRKWKDSLSLSEKKTQSFEYAIYNKDLTPSAKISLLYGITSIKGIAPRDEMIKVTKQKIKTFGFDDSCDIMKIIEDLICINISEAGTRVEERRLM